MKTICFATFVFFLFTIATCENAVALAATNDPQAFRTANENVSETAGPVLGLGNAAKVLCSTVFLTELDVDHALDVSVAPIMFFDDFGVEDITEMEIDRNEGRITLFADGLPARTAKLYGDQGCVLHPVGGDGVFFEPVTLKPAASFDPAKPWPLGEAVALDELPDGLNRDVLNRAVAAAFGPESMTAAFLVVYKGKIIAERYAEGADKDTLLVSWSMGKSLTATLLGVIAEQQGGFDLNARAPVPEWSAPGDPRRAIRTVDLMRMSSGLDFSHVTDPPAEWAFGHPDHLLVYSGAIDVFKFSVDRPLEHPPGAVGRYRNSDPLTVGYIIRRLVEKRGQNYLSFPQTDLFNRIGIQKLVLEPDPYGNFVMTGFEYGRARDWARLGLLYLWDGDWYGDRILPEGWAEFVSTPAPAWEEPVYGGLFWLNPKEGGRLRLPEDAYYMAGGGVQVSIIVPSLDLVVVRMGHYKGGATAWDRLNEAFDVLAPEILRVRRQD